MANFTSSNDVAVDEAALSALAELATPAVTAALGKLGFEFTYATGITPLAPPEGAHARCGSFTSSRISCGPSTRTWRHRLTGARWSRSSRAR